MLQTILRHRWFITTTTWSNIKAKYRGSVLGLFWSFLQPCLQAAMLFFIFGHLLNRTTPEYFFGLLFSMVCWNFISAAISTGAESMITYSAVATHTNMPLITFPSISVLSQLFHLLFSLGVVLLLSFIFQQNIYWSWLIIPVLISALVIFIFSVSVTLSYLFVYLRDLRYLLPYFFQLLFYGTPIIYDLNQIPEKYHGLLYLNPFSGFFTLLKWCVHQKSAPANESLYAFAVWGLVFCCLSYVVTTKVSRNIVEDL